MPFSTDSFAMIGEKLKVKPIHGNGWVLYGRARLLQDLEVPVPFEAELIDVLFDCGEARILICDVDLVLAGNRFRWGALIARADPVIDLRRESVPCNMMFSKERPTIQGDKPYPDPAFVSPNAVPYVRGFGIVSWGTQSQASPAPQGNS